jgi:phosphohistidine phosphatase
MQLHLMRHGAAEDRAPSGRDGDRILCQRGREEVGRVARALHNARARTHETLSDRRSGIEIPCRVLSSPLVRARETAEMVRAVLGPPAKPWHPVEIRPELADGSIPRQLVRELAAHSVDAVVIGHQPVLEALVALLIEQARRVLPTGLYPAMVVTLEHLGSNRWQLACVMNPHDLPH